MTDRQDAASDPDRRAFSGHPDHPPAQPDQPEEQNEDLIEQGARPQPGKGRPG